MGRDVLFVNLKIKRSDFCTGMDAAGREERDDSVCMLRVANTHLDWVTEDEDVVRAVQLKEVYKALFTQGVYAGIFGGRYECDEPRGQDVGGEGGVYGSLGSGKGRK